MSCFLSGHAHSMHAQKERWRMDRGNACKCEAQPHPHSLLGRIVQNPRNPKPASFRFEVNSYTCTSQSRVSDKLLHPEVPFDLLSEPLPSVDDFFCILKSCRKSKNSACAERVHALMCENGLQDHVALGNYLVSVLMSCDCKSKALEVFNRVVERNQYSWTSLIHNAVECGEFRNALYLYQQSTEDSILLSSYTIVTLLQACRGLKCLNLGYTLHAQAIIYGFYSDSVYVRSSLVDLYGKCGALKDAQALIDKQPVCDVVSCTALIAGYVEQGFGNDALKCFEQMQKAKVPPNAVTFVCSLKASVIVGAMEKGQQIHNEVIKEGCERNPFIGSSLVDLYAKCGLLLEAQAVFDGLPDQDVVTWTALIGGYAEHGYSEEALCCLEKMEGDGLSQNAVTFMFGLKACSAIGAIKRLRELHAGVAKAGYDCDMVVTNTLVDSYAKWGFLADAWIVFNNMLVKDIASWNALILGYSEQGLGEEALKCFQNMKAEGTCQDVVTFVNTLKSCGSIQGIDEGSALHMEIVKKGFETNLCVGSAVLDMYMKCEFLEEAWETFHVLPVRDVVSWTAVIEGYAELELPEEALNCMEQMQQEGVPPNPFTYASGVKACKGLPVSSNGQEVHAELVKLGFEEDVVVCNSLVDMYSSLGLFLEAEAVFDKLPSPTDTSWNGLMGGYVDHGLDKDVLDCLDAMQQEGFILNAATSVLVLKACGGLGDIDKGREIHIEIVKEKLERNPFVNSSLVNMYSKCGFLQEALEVFSELPAQDAVSWTALIAGLVEGGFGQEALTYLEQMQVAGVPPKATSLAYGLKACGITKALDKGRGLHVDILTEELEGGTFVGSSLIDMYAKCGSMSDAQDVFNDLLIKDVVSWTTLLAGYSKHGLAREALACLQEMRQDVLPNAVTFICSLVACGSIGALNSGQVIHSEVTSKGLETNVASYLVDMYAKCGSLEEAKKVFDELVIREPMCWIALMSGYAKQGNAKEALSLVEQMQSEGVFMNTETWISVLKACGAMKAPGLCHKLYMLSMKGGQEKNMIVCRALANMYTESGLFAETGDWFIPSARDPLFAG